MNEVVKPWGEPISPRDSIRMLMRERGVTYKRLAELVGYAGTSSVQKILTSDAKMRLNKYLRLLRVLGGTLFIAYFAKDGEMNYANVAINNVPEVLRIARESSNITYKMMVSIKESNSRALYEDNPSIKTLCSLIEPMNGSIVFRDYYGNDYPIKTD